MSSQEGVDGRGRRSDRAGDARGPSVPRGRMAQGPGWRPDPEGRFEERFHDGARWTPRVRSGDADAVDTGLVAVDPSSWYRDPTGRFDQREFTDGAWTKRVRRGRAIAIDTEGATRRMRRPSGAPPSPTGTASQRPPGWYPDPRPRTAEGDDFWDPRPDLQVRERYWDGYEWTAKLREPGGQRNRAPAQLFMSRALLILGGIVVLVLVIATTLVLVL